MLIVLVIMAFAIPFFFFLAYYIGNKKFQARIRKQALIRMLDDSGEELGEFITGYTPGKGMVTIGKLAFPVEDKAIIRCRGTTIITVNASNGKMLDLRAISQTDHPINPYQLQSLLISIYAASRAGVVELVEGIKTRIDIILLIAIFTLILAGLNFMNNGGISSDLATIKAYCNASLLNYTHVKVL